MELETEALIKTETTLTQKGNLLGLGSKSHIKHYLIAQNLENNMAHYMTYVL